MPVASWERAAIGASFSKASMVLSLSLVTSPLVVSKSEKMAVLTNMLAPKTWRMRTMICSISFIVYALFFKVKIDYWLGWG